MNKKKKKKKNEEQRSQKVGDFNRVERGKSVKWEREEPPLLKPLFLLAHSNLCNGEGGGFCRINRRR